MVCAFSIFNNCASDEFVISMRKSVIRNENAHYFKTKESRIFFKRIMHAYKFAMIHLDILIALLVWWTTYPKVVTKGFIIFQKVQLKGFF